MPHASKSSQSPGLQTNDDGSVDVYFGPEAPGRQGVELDPDRRQGPIRGALPLLRAGEAALRENVGPSRYREGLEQQETRRGHRTNVRSDREEYAYAVGVQAALWGRPFPEYLHSIYEGVKAGSGVLQLPAQVLCAEDGRRSYVNTPNNVSIDAYGNADLAHRARRHQRRRAAGTALVHRPDRRHVRRDRLQHRRFEGTGAWPVLPDRPRLPRPDSRHDEGNQGADQARRRRQSRVRERRSRYSRRPRGSGRHSHAAAVDLPATRAEVRDPKSDPCQPGLRAGRA